MPVPSTIHYIFGMDEKFGGKPFSYIHHLCVQSAVAVNRPRDVVFHVAHEPRGEWWEATRPAITVNRVTPPSTVFDRRVEHFAHRADVLRLQIVQEAVDSACIRVVPAPGFNESDAEHLLRNARACVPEGVKLRVELANWVERTARGKAPLVVHRPPVYEALRRAGFEPPLVAA